MNAIDEAVADGVDVINYSISGSSTSIVSPEEMAFFNAAAAGVFVATSAGNSGDTVGVSSVAHNAPWEITVAASTHDRGATKTVKLGNGTTYTGVGVGAAVASTPLARSTDVALAGANPDRGRLCFSRGRATVLDPAKTAGKIVVCTAACNDRVDKSKAVKEAGGVGMVLANITAELPDGDFHSVPTIHVNNVHGDAVKAYAASPGRATATITATDTTPGRGADDGGLLVVRSGSGRQRRPAQAGHHGPGCGRDRFGGSARQRAAGTSTPTRAPRCPHRTSPASRR